MDVECFQILDGRALLNVKGVLFLLLRSPVPDSEFTFGLQLQQQLRLPRFDGPNDLGTLTPLTALRAVADKPFWRMGITGSLGFLLTQGRTDSELAAGVRLHVPGMSRATAQVFGLVQGLFGSQINAPLRGGLGLSVHFAWDNGTSLSGGYIQGRGEGAVSRASISRRTTTLSQGDPRCMQTLRRWRPRPARASPSASYKSVSLAPKSAGSLIASSVTMLMRQV